MTTSTNHRPMPGRRRRVASGVFVLWLILPVVARTAAVLAEPAPDNDGMVIEDRWTPPGVVDATPGSSDLPSRSYIAPAARIFYAGTTLGMVRAYDIDTRVPLGPALPMPPAFSGLTDPTTGDLYIGSDAASAVTWFGVRGGVLRQLGVADLSAVLVPRSFIVSIAVGPRAGVMWVMATSVHGQEPGVRLVEIDLRAFRTGTTKVSWARDLTAEGCTVPIHGNSGVNAGLGYIPARRALFMGCGTAGLSPVYQAPQTSGVGALSISGDPADGPTQAGSFTKHVRSGNFKTGDSLVDPVSGRVMISANSSGNGTSLYVFDAIAGRFIGSVAGGQFPFSQLGIDLVRGRMYGLTQDLKLGLLASDLRATPPTQPRRLPAVAQDEKKSPELMALPVDPVTGRLYLLYASGPSFRIVRDTAPAYVAPPAADPDGATSDIPEAPGRTAVSLSVDVQGYGSRYRSIGGPQNLFFNLTSLNAGDGSDRELRTSYLSGLNLTDQEASASAIGADADASTKSDSWPYTLARCSDFGGGETSDEQVGATTACKAGERALARASSDKATTGGVAVERTSLRAEATRDVVRGALATVVSDAEGVTAVSGSAVLRVRKVHVELQAWAKGRPGTAGFSFRRVVEDAQVNGTPYCSGVCTPADLDRLSRALGERRFEVEFPDPPGEHCARPEATLLVCAGSPGGYEALARRGPLEQLEQTVLNNQLPARVEVPGMVMTIVTDGPRSSRTIAELAGTAAEAHYGISALPGPPPAGGGGGRALGSLDGLRRSSDIGLTAGEVGLAEPPPDLGGVTVRDRQAPLITSPASVVRTTLHVAINGLRGLASVAPVWAVLLVPVHLSARRLLLLRRTVLLPGGTE